jgi:hypothetical protein
LYKIILLTILIYLEGRRAPMVPMTKAEYDAKQSKIREVYDPLSGRTR